MFEDIQKSVVQALLKMNYSLENDVRAAIDRALSKEKSFLGKKVLSRIIENIEIAEKERIPLCQDTGMVWFYIQRGQEFPLSFSLDKCLDEAVVKAYQEGYFRCSIVGDPLQERLNTKTNTPSVKYYELCQGNTLKIYILVKGFGSENMSQTIMLEPAAGENGVREFICKAVNEAGGSPCPPLFLGIGIGGTMDKAALLSKIALFRTVGERHEDKYYAELEEKMMAEINALGIGPAGLGGQHTCLNAAIEIFPTHIAGLPVAVSINCWADRKAILSFRP